MKALVQGSTHKIGSESQMPLEGPRCATTDQQHKQKDRVAAVLPNSDQVPKISYE